jgi:RHS repeat-associated protein
LTDSTGAISTQWTYDPFGNTSMSGSSTTNAFEYTGRENDSVGLALYYYRSRYYSPLLGRFISQDPLGLGVGTNLYSYVGGSPTNFADVLGMDPHPDPPPPPPPGPPVPPPPPTPPRCGPGSLGSGKTPYSAGWNIPGFTGGYSVEPQSNSFYLNPGVGFNTSPFGASGGPLNVGHGDPAQVLDKTGWTGSLTIQGQGIQFTANSSGWLAGPVTGVPRNPFDMEAPLGVSLYYTYGWRVPLDSPFFDPLNPLNPFCSD